MAQFVTAPGKKTSEYAATLITQLLGAVIAIVVLFEPGFEVSEATQLAVVSIASGVIGISSGIYSHGRSKVKQAAAEVEAKTGEVSEVLATKEGEVHPGGQF